MPVKFEKKNLFNLEKNSIFLPMLPLGYPGHALGSLKNVSQFGAAVLPAIANTYICISIQVFRHITWGDQ